MVSIGRERCGRGRRRIVPLVINLIEERLLDVFLVYLEVESCPAIADINRLNEILITRPGEMLLSLGNTIYCDVAGQRDSIIFVYLEAPVVPTKFIKSGAGERFGQFCAALARNCNDRVRDCYGFCFGAGLDVVYIGLVGDSPLHADVHVVKRCFIIIHLFSSGPVPRLIGLWVGFMAAVGESDRRSKEANEQRNAQQKRK